MQAFEHCGRRGTDTPRRAAPARGRTAARGTTNWPLEPGAPPDPADALALQRRMGNRAFSEMLDEPQSGLDAMADIDAVTRKPGSPMRPDVQRKMETDYGGEDFSDVRVHVDRDSAEAAGAKAYTTKTNHIVFRSVADMDDHTMRHELQHVRQQRAGRAPAGISHPSDDLEKDAEATATRLGQQPAGVQRTADAAHEHATVTGGEGAVQRMVLKTAATLYTKWAAQAGAGELTFQQKNWLWGKFERLVPVVTNQRKMGYEAAVHLLINRGITRELMEQEVSAPAATAEPAMSAEQHEGAAAALVNEADEAWRARESELPRLEPVTFNIEGLGRGVIAMLRGPHAPAHPGMLAWFSHGYEDRNPITIDTARRYAFAVREEQSLERIAPAAVFESLPGAFAGRADITSTHQAPGEYVRPHHHSELTNEIDRLIALVQHCDVAVLLSFDWADHVAPEWEQAKQATTPPLPVIIERANLGRRYDSLLILACRTPWSVNAAAEGSSRLQAELARSLRDGGANPQAALQQARDRYVATPEHGRVYR